MAEESEKRFEAIMEKLFQEPPKSSSSSKPNPNHSSALASASTSAPLTSNVLGVALSRGKKRPNVSSALGLVGQKSRSSYVEELQNSAGSSGAVCRPWDRDDLFRRLATFKSMTWFAKPEAVSAVNCARRGWINIDMDIIACESCGARLLFSTPSSWTQQQVEKAALVFSLKLDTGHKLLCPWVDNICDEKLANFPPKTAAALVEDYKKRCSVLLHLTALPFISPSAIEHMGSPALQRFLSGPSGVDKNKSADASYYQAQKLISLCGWEPHSLPYIVDCNVGKEGSSKIDNLANQSDLASNGLNLSVVSCSSDRNIEDHDSQVSGRALFEPNSVALKCRLCGANVGLWAFSSVEQPVEFLRLVGYTEVDGKNDSVWPNDGASKNSFSGNENHAGGGNGLTEGSAASTSSTEQTLNLGLTIAGGPPPAKQNYRATISLPVIGRILRAQFPMDPLVTKDQEMPLAEKNVTDLGANQISEPEFNKEIQLADVQIIEGGLTRDKEPVENVESTKTDDTVVMDSNRPQIGEFSSAGLEDNATAGNITASENNSGMVAEAAIYKHGDLQKDLEHGNAVESGALVVDGNVAHSALVKNSVQASAHESMEFDPIRQHRLFCPWIASSGNSSPGWRQTLSALLQHKEFSGTDSLSEKTPSSLIEMDDPVASIRKLFSSPPAKRMKHTPAR